MDKHAARSFLSVHRPGETPAEDRIAEAEKMAAADPELARWWQEDQELDRAIAVALAETPVPSDLRAKLISNTVPLFVAKRSWRRPAFLAAAAIVALAALFGLWRGPFKPAPSVADYRAEMVNFLAQEWTLGLKSKDLAQIHNFLAESGAPSQFEIPVRLRELEPIGCRKLQFHGQDVALVCFRRQSGKEAHLFVIKRGAVRGLPIQPQFAPEDGWMTAAWTTGDHGYLLTVQGDQNAAEQYIRDI
jgi:anti-sigma factor RsiW